MSGNVDVCTQVPIPMLKKPEYATWRTEVLATLEEIDPKFLNRLKENPTELKWEEFLRIKNWYWENHEKTESTDLLSRNIRWLHRENLKWIKDAQVRTILLNGLDAVTLRRVSGIPTARGVWEFLEELCQESEMVKKCKRICLMQEYEHFETNQNETLNEACARLVKLLKDLALLGKTYANEDTNLKFLWSLPEKWDTFTIIVREYSDLEVTSLEDLCTKLRMCEVVRSLERRTERQRRIKEHKGNLPYSDHSSSDSKETKANSDKEASGSELGSSFSPDKDKGKKKKTGVRTGKVKCHRTRHLVKHCRSNNEGKSLIPRDKSLTQTARQLGSINLTCKLYINSAAKIDIVKKKGSKCTWTLTLSN